MFKATLPCVLFLAASSPVSGDTLYQSEHPTPAQAAGFVPPNTIGLGSPTAFFDDAVINPAQNPSAYTQFVVTKLTIGMFRNPGAPATTVSFHAAEIGVNPDFNLYALQTIGSVSLPARSITAPAINTLISIGDGVKPIATIVGDTTWHFNGQVGVALGVSMTGNTAQQGWTLSPGALLGDNDPLYVAAYNLNTAVQSPVSFPNGLPGIMDFRVEGYAIPSPSAAALGLAFFKRRRRASTNAR
ncbi:MAG: hypothetical protein H6812_06420 [Phycisphaeraceae bacterium]|nr:hypothetical protein [Phycisphaerales bacterium]MCB9842879.1 hypothetical protein [Phycisphaeraceae bacterium]